jgi:hypothetical protein
MASAHLTRNVVKAPDRFVQALFEDPADSL